MAQRFFLTDQGYQSCDLVFLPLVRIRGETVNQISSLLVKHKSHRDNSSLSFSWPVALAGFNFKQSNDIFQFSPVLFPVRSGHKAGSSFR